MADAPIIPLFPLSIVVFPGHSVPLHIFEERYKEMIIDCSPPETGGEFAPFGIVLQMGGVVEDVGCSVVITDITERYADGSFDVITRARRRFRTLHTHDDRAYLSGAIEYFDDDADEQADPALASEVWDRFTGLMEVAKGEVGGGEEPGEDPASAPRPDHELDSFAVAARATLSLKQRQRLLAMRSEGERLHYLADYFEEALPRMRERVQRKHRAKSNGRSK